MEEKKGKKRAHRAGVGRKGKEEPTKGAKKGEEEVEKRLIERIGRGIRQSRITEAISSAGEVTGEVIRGLMSGRENVLMVRISREVMEKIDSLVDAGMARSRSEGAAFLMAVGISSQEELFRLIEKKIAQIRKIREELQGMVKERVKGFVAEEAKQGKRPEEKPADEPEKKPDEKPEGSPQ